MKWKPNHFTVKGSKKLRGGLGASKSWFRESSAFLHLHHRNQTLRRSDFMFPRRKYQQTVVSIHWFQSGATWISSIHLQSNPTHPQTTGPRWLAFFGPRVGFTGKPKSMWGPWKKKTRAAPFCRRKRTNQWTVPPAWHERKRLGESCLFKLSGAHPVVCLVKCSRHSCNPTAFHS